ncbi:MAG: tyrosine-type recombinase/integrase, partial [Actinomycetota bacterium]
MRGQRGSLIKRCTRRGCRATTRKPACPKCGGRSFRWYYVLDDQLPGQTRDRTFSTGYATFTEAQQALADELARRSSGVRVARSTDTVADYFDEVWFPRARVDLRPSTADGYRRVFDRYVRPRIGTVALQELRADHLNAIYTELLARGLAANTIRHAHIVLLRMLKEATRTDRVVRNVAALATPPKQRRPEPDELGVWSGVHFPTFITAAAGDRYFAMWRLFCSSGARRGEVVGLRWEDLDLKAGRWEVRRSLTVVNGSPTWSSPKTAHGRRTIALDAEDVGALRWHQRRQQAERAQLEEVGLPYRDHGLVFCHEDGRPLHPNVVTRWFQAILERVRGQAREEARVAGEKDATRLEAAADRALPRIRLHDVRHSVATALLCAGVPVKVVSERLGHASTAFTMDVYASVLPDMQRDASERMSVILGRLPVDPGLTREASTRVAGDH